MASKEAFDKSLKLCNIALLCSGITIYPKDNKLIISFLKFIYYFNIPWLYTDVFGEVNWFIDGVYEGKNVSELSFIAPCITICLLATAKSTPTYIYRETIIEIVAKLRKLHPNENELKDGTKNTEDKNDEDLYFENSEREDDINIVKDTVKFLNMFIALVFSSRFVDEEKLFKTRLTLF